MHFIKKDFFCFLTNLQMLPFKEIQLLPEIFLGIPIIMIYLFNTPSDSALNIKSTSAFRRVMPL
jgi:hypothetical protein